jgi:hypothetical protein
MDCHPRNGGGRPHIVLNFPQFLLNWKHHRLNEDADWKRLRLVSRTWCNRLDKIERWSTAPHLEIRDYAELVESSGVKGLRVYDNGYWNNRKSTPYPFDLELLLSARNITAISVDTTHLQRGFNDPQRGFNEFLLENPDYFPNVRSLSFSCIDDPDRYFGRPSKRDFLTWSLFEYGSDMKAPAVFVFSYQS